MRRAPRWIRAVAFGTLSVAPAPEMWAAAGGPEDLARGIEQVRQGDFENALMSLDSAARTLDQPEQTKQRAVAYLYLGAAYVGLKQPGLAQARFEQALLHDPQIAPSRDEFPPAVLKAFVAARQNLRTTAQAERAVRAKKGKGGAILLGLGGAAAAGVALAATQRSGPSPSAPATTLTVSPEGGAIAQITTVTFTATVSGQPAVFTWQFGDTGALVTGESVTHVFQAEGTFRVTLKARASAAESTSSVDVLVRSLTGIWQATPGFFGEDRYDMRQNGAQVTATVTTVPAPLGATVSGRVQDPRRVEWLYLVQFPSSRGLPYSLGSCLISAVGEVQAGLQSVNATLSCLQCAGLDAAALWCSGKPDRQVVLRR